MPVAPPGVCQLAMPLASEVSTLPAAGLPPVTCKPPAIRVALLPAPAYILVTKLSPNCMVLLVVATALAPMAVVLVKFSAATPAPWPIAVL